MLTILHVHLQVPHAPDIDTRDYSIQSMLYEWKYPGQMFFLFSTQEQVMK